MSDPSSSPPPPPPPGSSGPPPGSSGPPPGSSGPPPGSAGPPPPFGAADLPVNDTLGGQLLAINGTFAAAACLAVLLRLYVRAIMLKSFKTDDYIMVAALICGIGVIAGWIGEVNLGVGRHIMFIPPENFSVIMHWQFFESIVVMVGISLVKISIAFVLLRFVEAKHFRRFLYFMIAFLVAFTIACGGTLVFACIPVNASWDFSLKATANCFPIDKFVAIGSFNTSINIITDVIFVILPIPIIWRLNLRKRAKVSLIFILSLGVFACVAAIVKLNYQVAIAHERDPLRDDSFNLWNSVELYTGIIAACLPSLRPLFRAIGLDRSRTSGQSSYPTAGAGGRRSAYSGYNAGSGANSADMLNANHPANRHKLMLSSTTRESLSSRRYTPVNGTVGGGRQSAGSFAMGGLGGARDYHNGNSNNGNNNGYNSNNYGNNNTSESTRRLRLGSDASTSLGGSTYRDGEGLVRIDIPRPTASASPTAGGRRTGASPALGAGMGPGLGPGMGMGMGMDMYGGRGIDSGRWGGHSRTRVSADSAASSFDDDDLRLPRQGIMKRTDIEIV